MEKVLENSRQCQGLEVEMGGAQGDLSPRTLISAFHKGWF